eukprot:COSAG05_NODE_9593_length_613_cov_0.778210_1_plen_111_part_00
MLRKKHEGLLLVLAEKREQADKECQSLRAATQAHCDAMRSSSQHECHNMQQQCTEKCEAMHTSMVTACKTMQQTTEAEQARIRTDRANIMVSIASCYRLHALISRTIGRR